MCGFCIFVHLYISVTSSTSSKLEFPWCNYSLIFLLVEVSLTKTANAYNFHGCRIQVSWILCSRSHRTEIQTLQCSLGLVPSSKRCGIWVNAILVIAGHRDLFSCWSARGLFSASRGCPPFSAPWPSPQHGSLLLRGSKESMFAALNRSDSSSL